MFWSNIAGICHGFSLPSLCWCSDRKLLELWRLSVTFCLLMIIDVLFYLIENCEDFLLSSGYWCLLIFWLKIAGSVKIFISSVCWCSYQKLLDWDLSRRSVIFCLLMYWLKIAGLVSVKISCFFCLLMFLSKITRLQSVKTFCHLLSLNVLIKDCWIGICPDFFSHVLPIDNCCYSDRRSMNWNLTRLSVIFWLLMLIDIVIGNCCIKICQHLYHILCVDILIEYC